MSKLLYIMLLLLTIQACYRPLKSQKNFLDKKKWLTSSEYRYEIAKSTYFPDFKGKTKKDVKNILGEPDEINGEVFTYCFDLSSVKYYDKKLERNVCNCKGSFVTIDFKSDERWKTTFFWVESLP